MPFWLLYILMSFASFRMTRLITKDDFPPIRWTREKIITARPDVVRKDIDETFYSEHWWLGTLVTCGWCASAYVSGAMVACVWFMVGMPMPILIWLAVWGAAAFLVNEFGE